MFKILYQSFMATLLLGVILCGIYPLVVTGISSLVFPRQSEGSFIRDAQNKIVGSELIGQNFSKPEYFWSRLSAAGDKGYDPMNSGGSNLGPTNKKLLDRLTADSKRMNDAHPDQAEKKAGIPVELMTTSGSGLDPHISPEGAFYQVNRVAKARGIPPNVVEDLVKKNIEDREWGFFGEPRVNVLKLNLALDQVSKIN